MNHPDEALQSQEARWPTPEDDGDRQLLDDVRSVGWHVVGIEADDEGPAFAYTVGLHHSFGHPELVVFGLPVPTLFGVLNALGEAVKAGERFQAWEETDRALDGYSVLLTPVDPGHYREYLGYARWFYRGNEFSVLQCVWPDAQHRYPTEPGFTPQLSGLQPQLASAGEWPFPAGKNRATFITRPVLEEAHPILFVYHDADGAWQFLCGTTHATTDARLVSLDTVLQLDPSLAAVADLPTGWNASRSTPNSPWQRQPGEPEIR